VALSRDQKKLFPHFSEASTAVFAVEEVEYGGHDRTPLFDHHHAIISLGCQTDLDHSPLNFLTLLKIQATEVIRAV
jgi:hypothetical protein